MNYNMAHNKKYTPVQIPNESYEILKDYCKKNGLKLGGFLEILIRKACNTKPEGKKLPAIRILS